VSPRARIALLVAALALLAALAVTGVAVLSAEEVDSSSAATAPAKPQKGLPPLDLSFGAREDAEAQRLRHASDLYEAGRHAHPAKIVLAAKIFARDDSLEAKLGAAFAAWPASLDRIEQLGALFPRSALVQLHVGIARYWAGTGGAVTAWREARDVEPDTPYAVRAGDLLHPEFAPGLPLFVPSFTFRVEGASLAEQLDSLRVDTTLHGRLLYGVALQRLGRPVSARRAFAQALRLSPRDPDALVADAVGRYSKEHPEAAFSRLGPLTRRFPHFASVRFHLGVLLLWQSDVGEAKRQLRLARSAAPRSRIAEEAQRYLQELAKAGTG
jgi:tetratricopeptide (TPR) repeat protein